MEFTALISKKKDGLTLFNRKKAALTLFNGENNSVKGI